MNSGDHSWIVADQKDERHSSESPYATAMHVRQLTEKIMQLCHGGRHRCWVARVLIATRIGSLIRIIPTRPEIRSQSGSSKVDEAITTYDGVWTAFRPGRFEADCQDSVLILKTNCRKGDLFLRSSKSSWLIAGKRCHFNWPNGLLPPQTAASPDERRSAMYAYLSDPQYAIVNRLQRRLRCRQRREFTACTAHYTKAKRQDYPESQDETRIARS